MIKVDQSTIDPERGDCTRAVIASLFDLELEQVPNFRLFPDGQWFCVYWHFLQALGSEYAGYGKPQDLEEKDGVEGFFYGVVNSRTFPGKTHAVVIDRTGLVVHDPNPNRAWLNVNVVESGDLQGWHIIKKREDTQ